MAMSYTSKRLEYIDFLFPHIREAQMNIMYKVETQRIQLGDLQSEFVRTGTDLLNILIVISVAMVAGLLVFLVNGVLANERNILGNQNMKRLYDFPLQWFFQTTELYHHQSARIFRASWGLFCVTLLASYGALMTSNAAVPVERPVISGLKDLLDYPEFCIGISPSSTSLLTAFSKAEPGTTYAGIWQTLIRCNQSDERSFSPDKGYHIRRVLQGNYAFLANVPEGLLPLYADADYGDVRFVTLMNDQLNMAIPQNVFYKADLERATLLATEAGTIKAVFDKWIPPEADIKKSKVDNQTVVHLRSMRLLLTLTAYGVVAATFSLAVEKLLHYRTRRHV
ncbi:glutamate receptor ionotropic, kainate 2 [Plakobranchus ocellatus]|uniref:Glutamate receptor ionotropic, kainate 2 n=1 Tax=Plakobranchus ocellatus TaxID=259542 RepID=A0AAV3XW80_9GAST|nr:glutamate receptor ionotropic, kainate 2 [Plakobranchus ocellatus]